MDFARAAVARHLADPDALSRVFGELLTEPKPLVWFDAGTACKGQAVRLDRRSRMLYGDGHIYINGEALRAGGRDATLMHRLADTRALSAADCARLSAEAATMLNDWCLAGWVREDAG